LYVQESVTDTGDVDEPSADPFADVRVDDPSTPYDESLTPEDEGFDPVADALGRQRRQNVRVDVQLPITLRMHGRDAPGRTRDVSATGIGFSTRLAVQLEDRGEVTVEFNGWRFTKAFIVRFVKPILAGCQVGVQFDELTQEEREKLVKQVFDVQRAQLQGARGAR
jgi:c-di-GMP-binding flagellar brake protein YcgR